jgi:hypothetical protein
MQTAGKKQARKQTKKTRRPKIRGTSTHSWKFSNFNRNPRPESES